MPPQATHCAISYAGDLVSTASRKCRSRAAAAPLVPRFKLLETWPRRREIQKRQKQRKTDFADFRGCARITHLRSVLPAPDQEDLGYTLGELLRQEPTEDVPKESLLVWCDELSRHTEQIRQIRKIRQIRDLLGSWPRRREIRTAKAKQS